MTSPIDLSSYLTLAAEVPPLRHGGRVVQAVGLTIEAEGLTPHIGEICHIQGHQAQAIPAEVVGFKAGRTILMPFGEPRGVTPASAVYASGRHFTVPVGLGLLGRILDGFGNPIDGKGPLASAACVPMTATAPHPLRRHRISTPCPTGVRAIDSLLTVGRGQRLGIFAGSGVGKSTLLGMIGRNAVADANVIALIGERGREVQEFIEHDLGEEGLAKSVVVVATSDKPALARLKGAWVATTIAEYLRDQGLQVVLLMDSVTRFAMAQREVGIAAGEPPASKGYPPSVFAALPPLLERAGTGQQGAITGFYTVLVEGDDQTEPITDTVRSILDGHIVLSRDLAGAGHYPPIDVLNSVSRLASQVTSEQHRELAIQFRRLMATYRDAKDLIQIGAYVAGSNPELDRAIAALPAMEGFLRQRPDEAFSLEDTILQLEQSLTTEEASHAIP